MAEICQWIRDAKVAVPANLIYAIIMEESGGQPDIVSSTGAVGLMQIEQKYYPNSDLTDPITNIRMGASILTRYYLYTNDADKPNWRDIPSVRLALSSYYAGPGNIKGIPESRWPPATEGYCANILSLYGRKHCG